jgi:hypothetical protein
MAFAKNKMISPSKESENRKEKEEKLEAKLKLCRESIFDIFFSIGHEMQVSELKLKHNAEVSELKLKHNAEVSELEKNLVWPLIK